MQIKWKLGGMMFASLLTVASCQNEDIISNEQVQGNYSLVVTNGADSRTYVESDGTVKWSTGDKLFVYGTNVSGTLQLSKTENEGKTGTFTGFVSGNPGNLEWAVFGDNVKKISNGATFTIDEISNPNSNSPMVGEIKDDGTVQMEHLCGMVRITINDLPTGKTVNLNGTGIAGTATVVDGEMTVTTPSNDITISVTNPTEDPAIEVPVFATANKVDKEFTLTVDNATYKFKAPIAIGSLSEKAILELTCVVEEGKVTGFKQAATTAESLKNAIESLQSRETLSISLADDIELSDAIEVPAGTTVNLDLGGKTLSNDEGYSIENKGTLTINGEGGISGLGGIRSTAGKITINSGTFTGSSKWQESTYQHTLKVENTEVIINGGTFDATVNGQTNAMINVADGSTMTINGGTFKNVVGKLTNFDPYLFTYEGSGKLTINNGTFYGGWRFNETATTDIYGGNFSLTTDGQSFQTGNTHVLTVYGGTFTFGKEATQTSVLNCVASGYKAIQSGNSYTVVPSDATVVQYNSDQNGSQNGQALYTAINNATDGATIYIGQGTYEWTDNSNNRFKNKSFTLIGLEGAVISVTKKGIVCDAESDNGCTVELRDITIKSGSQAVYAKNYVTVNLYNVKCETTGTTAIILDSANPINNQFIEGVRTVVNAYNITIDEGDAVEFMARPCHSGDYLTNTTYTEFNYEGGNIQTCKVQNGAKSTGSNMFVNGTALPVSEN